MGSTVTGNGNNIDQRRQVAQVQYSVRWLRYAARGTTQFAARCAALGWGIPLLEHMTHHSWSEASLGTAGLVAIMISVSKLREGNRANHNHAWIEFQNTTAQLDAEQRELARGSAPE